MRTKAQRKSGRVTTKIYHPEKVPLEETYWDDWVDYRDGFRDPGRDKTLKYRRPKFKKHNLRIRIKELIRRKRNAKKLME